VLVCLKHSRRLLGITSGHIWRQMPSEGVTDVCGQPRLISDGPPQQCLNSCQILTFQSWGISALCNSATICNNEIYLHLSNTLTCTATLEPKKGEKDQHPKQFLSMYSLPDLKDRKGRLLTGCAMELRLFEVTYYLYLNPSEHSR
jgi:hypothetical protein